MEREKKIKVQPGQLWRGGAETLFVYLVKKSLAYCVTRTGAVTNINKNALRDNWKLDKEGMSLPKELTYGRDAGVGGTNR